MTSSLIFQIPYYDPKNPIMVADVARRLFPNVTDDDITDWINEKRLLCDGTPVIGSPSKHADYGVVWEFRDPSSVTPEAHYAEPTILARGNGWTVIEKPDNFPGTIYAPNLAINKEVSGDDLPPRDSDPMHPLKYVADVLGYDREEMIPLWEMPFRGGGPWVLCEDREHYQRLTDYWQSGKLMLLFTAITPKFDLPTGRILSESSLSKGLAFDYYATRMSEQLIEMQFTPDFASFFEEKEGDQRSISPYTLIKDALAGVSHRVLMDLEASEQEIKDLGITSASLLVGGSERLRLTAIYESANVVSDAPIGSWAVPIEDAGWWPKLAPLPTEGESETYRGEKAKNNEVRPLLVSLETIKVMQNHGHPWVLADSKTDGLQKLNVGELAELRVNSPNRRNNVTDNSFSKDKPLFVLINSKNDALVARFWCDNREEAGDVVDEALIRFDEAFAAREDLLSNSEITLFRLVHGEADRLPGLYLDRCGPYFRATIYGGTAIAFKEAIYDELQKSFPHTPLLEIDHRRDIRQASEFPTAVQVRGTQLNERAANGVVEDERVVGKEDGLSYYLEPWKGIDTGFFADQRENRRLLETIVPEIDSTLGGKTERWLNLFCHTGAFTVKLLSLGARCVSVDISARYLEWLEDNLALNQLDMERNMSVAEDARKYVKKMKGIVSNGGEGFDGIIVDPPTAAAGDGSFWSIRKDFQVLIEDCFSLLRGSKGKMLVCRNDRKRSKELDEMIREGARSAGVQITKIERAPIAPDYPTLVGFDEGTIFDGRWITVNRSEKGG